MINEYLRNLDNDSLMKLAEEVDAISGFGGETGLDKIAKKSEATPFKQFTKLNPDIKALAANSNDPYMRGLGYEDTVAESIARALRNTKKEKINPDKVLRKRYGQSQEQIDSAVRLWRGYRGIGRKYR